MSVPQLPDSVFGGFGSPVGGEYGDFIRKHRAEHDILARYDGNTSYAQDVRNLNADLLAGKAEAQRLYAQFIAWRLKR